MAPARATMSGWASARRGRRSDRVPRRGRRPPPAATASARACRISGVPTLGAEVTLRKRSPSLAQAERYDASQGQAAWVYALAEARPVHRGDHVEARPAREYGPSCGRAMTAGRGRSREKGRRGPRSGRSTGSVHSQRVQGRRADARRTRCPHHRSAPSSWLPSEEAVHFPRPLPPPPMRRFRTGAAMRAASSSRLSRHRAVASTAAAVVWKTSGTTRDSACHAPSPVPGLAGRRA